MIAFLSVLRLDIPTLCTHDITGINLLEWNQTPSKNKELLKTRFHLNSRLKIQRNYIGGLCFVRPYNDFIIGIILFYFFRFPFF